MFSLKNLACKGLTAPELIMTKIYNVSWLHYHQTAEITFFGNYNWTGTLLMMCLFKESCYMYYTHLMTAEALDDPSAIRPITLEKCAALSQSL